MCLTSQINACRCLTSCPQGKITLDVPVSAVRVLTSYVEVVAEPVEDDELGLLLPVPCHGRSGGERWERCVA